MGYLLIIGVLVVFTIFVFYKRGLYEGLCVVGLVLCSGIIGTSFWNSIEDNTNYDAFLEVKEIPITKLHDEENNYIKEKSGKFIYNEKTDTGEIERTLTVGDVVGIIETDKEKPKVVQLEQDKVINRYKITRFILPVLNKEIKYKIIVPK